MKERPILFQTEMVRAILEGRKTQTRRIVKGDSLMLLKDGVTPISNIDNTGPYGQPGDILWVRETWQPLVNGGPTGFGLYGYKADDPVSNMPWKPSIHMPKAACRLRLKITDIRVERLLDIVEDDCRSEGIEKMPGYYRNYLTADGMPALTPYMSYQTLWQKINGPESWDLNPWVWVIEFEIIKLS